MDRHGLNYKIIRTSRTSIMISEQEKEKIRQEEIYRREIRQEIAKTAQRDTFTQKIWAFLNCPLGLWFLSTIAIGIISWSYSQWQANQVQIQEYQKQRRKLNMEVASRIQTFKNFLANAQNKEQLYYSISFLDDPEVDRFNLFIFPEFRKRSLRSLLWELNELVEKDEQADINEAILASEQLNDFYLKRLLDLDSSHNVGDEPAPKKEVDMLKRLVDTKFAIFRFNRSN